MLTHIVIWKYCPDVDQETRDRHVAALRSLSNLLPQIISFKVGADMLHLPRSYDTGLVAVFQNRAALDAYTVHPDHVEVINLGRSISEHAASVDFED
jgi:Stress responsive A/B Barrel Domain